jgi:hypothetical protein
MLSMEKYANRGKIGGPNHIIQIHECKIGRQKFHRGRVVEGNWILEMTDINPKGVHMDAWRGYNGLLASGFANHLTVNNSCIS